MKFLSSLGVLLLLAWVSLGVSQTDMANTLNDIKARHEAELLALPGVVSVGVGHDEQNRLRIIIGVAQKTEAVIGHLPQELEGFPIAVQSATPPTAKPFT